MRVSWWTTKLCGCSGLISRQSWAMECCTLTAYCSHDIFDDGAGKHYPTPIAPIAPVASFSHLVVRSRELSSPGLTTCTAVGRLDLTKLCTALLSPIQSICSKLIIFLHLQGQLHEIWSFARWCLASEAKKIPAMGALKPKTAQVNHDIGAFCGKRSVKFSA